MYYIFLNFKYNLFYNNNYKVRKILNILLAIIAVLSFNHTNAALWVVDSISLENSSDNSLEISWWNVEGAFWYYVYYSEEARNTNWYDDPTVEFVEENKYNIVDLEKLTKYYVSIRVVDQEWNEWEYSDEVYFITNWIKADRTNFWLTNVKVEKLNKLILTFNSALDDWANAERDIKLVKKGDELNLININSNELRGDSELVLNLDSELVVWWEYNLTVIIIKSKSGDTIESWIDGLFSFIVPDSFKPVDDIVVKKPECYWLTLWDTTWDAPFETSVSCEWKDVENFRVECWNWKVNVWWAVNGETSYITQCKYDTAWVYEVACYINWTISSEYCKDTITIYSPITVDENENVVNNNWTNDDNSEKVLIDKWEEWKKWWKNENNVETDDSWKNPDFVYWKWWTNVKSNVFSNNTKIVASKQNNLPQTWPENIVVIVLSFFLWIIIMLVLRRKKS